MAYDPEGVKGNGDDNDVCKLVSRITATLQLIVLRVVISLYIGRLLAYESFVCLCACLVNWLVG